MQSISNPAEDFYDMAVSCDKDGNIDKAVEWYLKAAEQGLAKAQYNLGCCYQEGDGINADYYKAVKWYRKAADQGHADAQHNQIGRAHV